MRSTRKSVKEEKGNTNMKKNGFTLAEVLITLAIIGVVAVMTIPNLMNNTTGAQTATSFKKFVSTMEEVNQLASAQYGYSFGTLTGAGASKDEDPTGGTLCGIMGSLTSIESCDGSLIKFKDGAEFHISSVTAFNSADGTYGSVTGIYDANGDKGPHKTSDTNSKEPTTVDKKSDLQDRVEVTFNKDGVNKGTADSLVSKLINDKI